MIEPDGFLARFQAYEYALAFRVGRASMANYSITSGVSIYRRDTLERALAAHSMSVYAEDFENAMILLSLGETIYYDGRLVVSTEGPGKITRWFSQRVGWYHGLLRVYWTRFGEVWKVSRRSPFAFYHFIGYVGVLSLGLHLAKMVSAVILLISLFSGIDQLLVSHVLPASGLTDPGYFVSAIGSYLALGVVALFTVVPKSERAYAAPIVPLYLFYALVHIVPMTVGFANWVTLQFLGRRLYRDHYDSEANLRASRAASRSVPEKAA
jgi:cellulose synthase/poly-beta-1,6-N-acetylglucosamine synthase-like glycosyltransferase